MDISQQILSDLIIYMKYAKYLPELHRRETWDEIIDRNIEMHIRKFPKLEKEIRDVYERSVRTKKVLPSLRSLQFAGKPIEIANNRLYNCGFVAIDNYKSFAEVLFLLLGGSGMGISVQKHHVHKLPEIKVPTRKRRFLVDDSIRGWAEAVEKLCKAYFLGDPLPVFDFRDIRPKGAILKTSGGKAPGPEPLKDGLNRIQLIFERKKHGEKLTTLEAHDICCHLGDMVLSGGIRRSALLSLFSYGDYDMLTSKFGDWYELNPQRGRANNSVMLLRNKVKEKDFFDLWSHIKESQSGEPGVFFSSDKNGGCNACSEIYFSSSPGFCNLTEINASTIESQEDLNQRAIDSAFIGTLQATYTDFYFLRDEWKENVEKDALLGCSMTGIASGTLDTLDIEEASAKMLVENERVANLLGINKAVRIGSVKPAGTSSLVLGSSSGIHAWYAPFYIRRIRVGKDEVIYKYLKKVLPEFIEDDYFKPKNQAIISIPQKAPAGAICRKDETAIQLLERVKNFRDKWIIPSHRKGNSTHNISVTVPIKNDEEWGAVGKWMWENKDSYNGISVLPDTGHTYIQMPFEEIDEKKYNELFEKLKNIDLSKVKEEQDNTDRQGEAACSGGACEII